MVLRKPTSLAEAQQYIGRPIVKYFKETDQDYKGVVKEVDTEVETNSGEVEQGLFYKVVYEDEDEEHLSWSELAVCLARAKKQTKNKGSSGGRAAASSGAADVAAVNDRSSNKRQRRSGDVHNHSTDMPAAAAGAADVGYEQPLNSPAGQSAGSKRRRANATQQQQQEQPEEASPPVTLSPSARKHARKSTRPRMAVVPCQQQDQWQQRLQPGQARKQAAAAAAAAADAVSEEEEEEEEDAVEDDDSGSEETPQQRRKQQRPSKKARTNRHKKQQQQQQPDSADEDLELDAADDAAGEVADDEELDAAAEEEEQQHDYTEEELARQRPLVVRRQGLAGHIKNVQVQNFMCHHNFLMEFGTHVNVISGRNGSGKSAVLQAMQAALGAKAKDTGRGDNFRELVRTGCHEARIKVTLWNTGADAYQHPKFGDWVTVERVIKAGSGGNTYKLLDSAGKKVAEGYKAVLAMLDHLNVDASNPLAVLTQDTARNFLCGSVADKKKYEIFMKATCLQTMYDHLVRASQYVNEMKAAFKGIQDEHTARQQKVSELKTKLQKLQESASLVELRTTHERASIWAGVKAVQANVDIVREQLEVAAPKRQAKLGAHMAQAKQKLEDVQRRNDELLAAQQAEDQHTRNFTEAMDALAKELKMAKAVCRSKQQAAKKLEGQLHRVQAEIKQTMEAKRETNDDRQREYEERLRQHELQMAEAQQQQQQAEAHVLTLQQQKDSMREAVQAKENELQRLKSKLQADQQTHANLTQHLQHLQQAKGQQLAMFGPHANLRRLVDQNRNRFSQLPIGPIGAHLTLTDVRWAVAGEVVLGSALETWIVHNGQDNKTLRDLAGQVGIRSIQILVIDFNRQAYTIPDSKCLQPGWNNMREFIKIDHTSPQARIIIDNKLMDETHYEVVVIHEDEGRVRDAVYNAAAGLKVPRAVHISGQNYVTARNNTIMASHYSNRRPARIGASFQDNMAQTQQDLQQAQLKLAETQRVLTAVNGELQQLRHQMNTLAHQEKQALGTKARAVHRVQTLQMQAPVLEVDQGDGEDLVADQLCQLQETLHGVQLQYDKAAMELQEARIKEEQAQKLHADRKAEMDQTLSQMNDRQEQLDKLADEKASAMKYKAGVEAKAAEFERGVTQLQQNMALYTKQLEDAKKVALQQCTEEEGWVAHKKATDLLEAEVADKLRTKMQQQWTRDQMQYANQEAFEAALAQHVQENMAKFTAADMGPNNQGGCGMQMFKKKMDMLDKRIKDAEQEAGGNKEELEMNLRRAEAVYNKNNKAVQNMRAVVDMSVNAVNSRWTKYDQLFTSVKTTVSHKFHGYMFRRGHQGRVDVNQEAGELKLMVKMNTQAQGADAKQSKAVKDLKQLSGGERSYTTVAFILALGKFTESPFRAMDEYDVFMDAVNRRIATQTLLAFALEENEMQFVLLTPQDLQAVEDAKQHLAASRHGQALPEGFVKVVQMRPAREGGQQHH